MTLDSNIVRSNKTVVPSELGGSVLQVSSLGPLRPKFLMDPPRFDGNMTNARLIEAKQLKF